MLDTVLFLARYLHSLPPLNQFRPAVVTTAGSNLALTWGCGDDGQLGHGSAESRPVPGVLSELVDKKVTSITCGAEYTVAICEEDDEVYSWGW